MKIKNINKRTALLESVCHDLDKEQRYIVEGVVSAWDDLLEVELRQDQINNLFPLVQKLSDETGKNRTAVGLTKDKIVDTTKAANEYLNKVGKLIQDTKPVENFDNKFEKLKTDIKTKLGADSKITTGIENLSKYAKMNPGKTAFAIGVMTALVGISTGGSAIAIGVAATLLKGSVEVLKGEKLSTAIGKGLKTGVISGLAAGAFNAVGDWLSGLQAEVVPFEGLDQITFDVSGTDVMPGFEWKGSMSFENLTVLPSDADLAGQLVAEFAKGDASAFDALAELAKKSFTPEYTEQMAQFVSNAKEIALQNDATYQAIVQIQQGIASAAGGAVAGKSVSDDRGEDQQELFQSYTNNGILLTERRIERLFDTVGYYNTNPNIEFLGEGPVWDTIKKDAIAKAKELSKPTIDKAKTVSGNTMNVVTADKLKKAWKTAGSPTDSEVLARFLEKNKVSPDVIASAYKDLKLPDPNDDSSPEEKEEKELALRKTPQMKDGQYELDLASLPPAVRQATSNLWDEFNKLTPQEQEKFKADLKKSENIT